MPEPIEQLFLEHDRLDGIWAANNICHICKYYNREYQCSCGQDVCEACWDFDEDCCIECAKEINSE